jgi:hypothetical protein
LRQKPEVAEDQEPGFRQDLMIRIAITAAAFERKARQDDVAVALAGATPDRGLVWTQGHAVPVSSAKAYKNDNNAHKDSQRPGGLPRSR